MLACPVPRLFFFRLQTPRYALDPICAVKFTCGQVRYGSCPTTRWRYQRASTSGIQEILHPLTPRAESDVMTSDEIAWMVRIEDAIKTNNALLHTINANGCAKAGSHDDHEHRLRSVENQQAESRGKMVMLSGVISVIAVIIGKLFK